MDDTDVTLGVPTAISRLRLPSLPPPPSSSRLSCGEEKTCEKSSPLTYSGVLRQRNSRVSIDTRDRRYDANGALLNCATSSANEASDDIDTATATAVAAVQLLPPELQGKDDADHGNPSPLQTNGPSPPLSPPEKLSSPPNVTPLQQELPVIGSQSSAGLATSGVPNSSGGTNSGGSLKVAWDTCASRGSLSINPSISRAPPSPNPLQGEGLTLGDAVEPSPAQGAGVPLEGAVEEDVPVQTSFIIPRCCPDDALLMEDRLWVPGKPLRVAYVTWNMAGNEARMEELSAYCIHPNAHIIAVGTQENGPYTGTNRCQRRWAKLVSQVCLHEKYELVAQHHMWAVQMLVFARSRDVAKYVSRVESSHVKTGLCNGLCGNKGGVGVALALSLTPKDLHPAQRTRTRENTGSDTFSAASVGSERQHGNAAASVGTDHSAERSISSPLRVRANMVGTLASSGASPALLIPTPPSSSVKIDAGPNAGATVPTTDGRARHAKTLREKEFGTESRDTAPPTGDERCRSRSNNASRSRSHRHGHRIPSLMRRSGCGDCCNARSRTIQGGSTVQNQKPDHMTLLFITAHMAPHQGAVQNRNRDYLSIVRKLQLGRRGRHRAFFKRLQQQKRGLYVSDEGERISNAVAQGDAPEQDRDEEVDSEPDVQLLRLPRVSKRVGSTVPHDITDEFDVTFFGGDLNYRINGQRPAVEFIIRNLQRIRAVLIHNDQLSLERARGTVFHGFQEGNILFCPTYKYEVSASTGTTLNEYNFSRKAKRIPAFCDRILYKREPNSVAGHISIRLYTDVPQVRTSDHRPVVALFDVRTIALLGRKA